MNSTHFRATVMARRGLALLGAMACSLGIAGAQARDWESHFPIDNAERAFQSSAVADGKGNIVSFGPGQYANANNFLHLDRVTNKGVLISTAKYLPQNPYNSFRYANVQVDSNGDAVAMAAEMGGIGSPFLGLRFPANGGKPIVTAVTSFETPTPNYIALNAAGDLFMLGTEGNGAQIVVTRAQRNGKVKWTVHPARKDQDPTWPIYGVKLAVDAASGNILVLVQTAKSSRAFTSVMCLKTTNGSILWEKDFEAGGNTYPIDFTQSPDGNLFLISKREYPGYDNSLVVSRMNASNGDILWFQEFIDFTDSGTQAAIAPKRVVAGPDNSAYVASVSYRGAPGSKLNLRKLDSAGGVIYNTYFHQSSPQDFNTVCEAPLPDGSVYISSDNNDALVDSYVLKVGPNGEVQLQGDCSVPGFYTNAIQSLVPMPNGSVVAAGSGMINLGGGKAQWDLQYASFGSNPTPLSIKVEPSRIYGSLPATGTVSLLNPAPAGGLTVHLKRTVGLTGSTTPSSVVIPAGQKSATFEIKTKAVSKTERPVLAATSTAGAAQIGYVVAAPNLVTLSLPSVIYGSVPTTGTVTLDHAPIQGDAYVSLASNTFYIQIPDWVVVPKGKTSATFTVLCNDLGVGFGGWVRANLDESGRIASFAVTPPSLSQLVVDSTILGGQTGTAKITMNGQAQGDWTVSLTSSTTNLKVPASVKISAGESSAEFPVTAATVAKDITVKITATSHDKTITATVVIKPVKLTEVSVSPSTVQGGKPAAMTVKINTPSLGAGVVISLKSSVVGVVLPATVTIPAGQTSATVALTTSKVTANKTVTLTAKVGTQSMTSTLTVTP